MTSPGHHPRLTPTACPDPLLYPVGDHVTRPVSYTSAHSCAPGISRANDYSQLQHSNYVQLPIATRHPDLQDHTQYKQSLITTEPARRMPHPCAAPALRSRCCFHCSIGTDITITFLHYGFHTMGKDNVCLVV